jgi:hypothetical protein
MATKAPIRYGFDRVQVLRNICVAGVALRLRPPRGQQFLLLSIAENGAEGFLRRHQWE